MTVEDLQELEQRIEQHIDRLRHHMQGQVTDCERHLQAQITSLSGQVGALGASPGDTVTIEWATKDTVDGLAGSVREVKGKVNELADSVGELSLNRRAWVLVGKVAAALVGLVATVLGVLVTLNHLGWL